ncbi:hypothetical protein Ais01nite_81730 [Asanoa ishikariensis]|uniref:PH domain-containing protein n=1 Tax=Asanoa ishikariensis TaxID=137265 RepID=A0A1H3SED9_9ACTN|nr:PH domain-containing protein [Asanoa ishikariensis]GIF70138.1 hypothetical protein Ais01nite_81730 [Asanoa ishikariensis]SDZ36068.1 PH domain-containing protein [Asanoa ishikariensis]
MPRWRPVVAGHDRGRYGFAVGWSVVGLVPAVAPALTGRTVAALVALPIVLLWQVGLWRTVLVGVYVSAHGIKVRSVARTRVVPWSQVDRVWTGQADGYDAWQIWVTTREPQRHIPTPIWRRGSQSFHLNRIVLPADQFSAVLAALAPGQLGSV